MLNEEDECPSTHSALAPAAGAGQPVRPALPLRPVHRVRVGRHTLRPPAPRHALNPGLVALQAQRTRLRPRACKGQEVLRVGRRDVALGQAQPVVPSEPRPGVALVDLLRSAPRHSESVASASSPPQRFLAHRGRENGLWRTVRGCRRGGRASAPTCGRPWPAHAPACGAARPPAPAAAGSPPRGSGQGWVRGAESRRLWSRRGAGGSRGSGRVCSQTCRVRT